VGVGGGGRPPPPAGMCVSVFAGEWVQVTRRHTYTQHAHVEADLIDVGEGAPHV